MARDEFHRGDLLVEWAAIADAFCGREEYSSTIVRASTIRADRRLSCQGRDGCVAEDASNAERYFVWQVVLPSRDHRSHASRRTLCEARCSGWRWTAGEIIGVIERV
jgi:hypothetical protein